MVTEDRLDLSHLRASTVPFQVLLFISGAIGVALGLAMIITGLFFTTMLTPVGVVAAIWAAVSFGTQAANLILLGALAVVLLPLGAIVAAHLKLKGKRDQILHEAGPTMLQPGSELEKIFNGLARRAGLDVTPKYGVMQNVTNAYALSGDRDVGLVLVGMPLLRGLSPPEILAIIGHEIGHIALMDSKRMALAVGHQQFLFRFLIISGLQGIARSTFGLIAELALAAHSRHREYWADAVGAYLVGTEHMISALDKLHKLPAEPTRLERKHQELMIRPVVDRLFSTHPTVEKRIAALQARTYLNQLPVRQVELPPPPAPPQTSYEGI